MKNIILILIIILSTFSSVANAQVFDLSSAKKTSYLTKREFPVVYKPSKLVIGATTIFTVKADPQSHVSLLTSEENTGIAKTYGHTLRLGQFYTTYEGMTDDKGIAEIKIPLPDKNTLVGSILYFEVIVWKQNDFSDLKIAKIMGIDGRETAVNAVVVGEPPKKHSMPGVGPAIPGLGSDMNRTMEIMNRINETPDDNYDGYYSDPMIYKNEPLMIRNLHAPQSNTNNKEN